MDTPRHSFRLFVSSAVLVFAIALSPLAIPLAYAQATPSPAQTEAQAGINQLQAAANAADQKGATPNNAAECHFYDPTTWIPCMFQTSMEYTGIAFIYLGIMFLKMSGYIFNTLVTHTLIQFGLIVGSSSGTGLQTAINTGWTVFRDIANILIIALFVFIAISTILGIEQYGYKKLIARVLIIAILINFSLLFTNMIIDASDFTAYQFYAQMSKQSNTEGGVQNFDMGAAFLKSMKIDTFAATQKSVQNFGAQLSASSNTLQGLGSLGYGIFLSLLLMAVAIVLFYGSFIIGMRAVVFVLLMITASLAFATYLIPNYAQSGWSKWWKALLQNAVLAPIMMIFLFITLTILQAAATLASGQSLGQALTSSNINAQPGFWAIFFVYILGVGFLYASFKVSNMLAHSVGNVGLPGMSKFEGLLSNIGGFMARQTVGRGSAKVSGVMMDAAAQARKEETTLGRLRASALYNASRPLTNLAKKDFGGPKAGGFMGSQQREALAFQKAQRQAAKSETETKKDDQTPRAAAANENNPQMQRGAANDNTNNQPTLNAVRDAAAAGAQEGSAGRRTEEVSRPSASESTSSQEAIKIVSEEEHQTSENRGAMRAEDQKVKEAQRVAQMNARTQTQSTAEDLLRRRTEANAKQSTGAGAGPQTLDMVQDANGTWVIPGTQSGNTQQTSNSAESSNRIRARFISRTANDNTPRNLDTSPQQITYAPNSQTSATTASVGEATPTSRVQSSEFHEEQAQKAAAVQQNPSAYPDVAVVHPATAPDNTPPTAPAGGNVVIQQNTTIANDNHQEIQEEYTSSTVHNSQVRQDNSVTSYVTNNIPKNTSDTPVPHTTINNSPARDEHAEVRQIFANDNKIEANEREARDGSHPPEEDTQRHA